MKFIIFLIRQIDTMKEGEQLLKLNKSNEKIGSDLLPVRFIEFANRFVLGEGAFAVEILRREGIDFDLPLTNIVFESGGNEMELEYIYSVDQIHAMLDAGEAQEAYFINDKMIKIAHLASPSNASIYMSTASSSENQIYVGMFTFNSKERYQLISRDIFSLASLLRSKLNRYQLNEKTIPKLYRNWNECFWRIRE